MAERYLFSNEARSQVVGSVSAAGTEITLADGDLFPSPAGGECFHATLFELSASQEQERVEIVKVTKRDGNALTVVRDIERLGAKDYPSASGSAVYCELRLTAGVMKEVLQKADAQGFAPANHTHSKESLGLGNVDNTADADKPVSAAQQNAIESAKTEAVSAAQQASAAAINEAKEEAKSKVAKTIPLPSGHDLDTVVESGFYRLEDRHVHAPKDNDCSFGQMIVSRGRDTIVQMAFDYHGNGFFRSGNPNNTGGAGQYSEWRKLLHTGIFNPDNAFLNRDTVVGSGTDMNGLTTPGVYHVTSNPINSPKNGYLVAGVVLVFAVGDGVVQIAIANSGHAFLRSRYAGSWKPWMMFNTSYIG